MLSPITITYPVTPKKRTLAAAEVCDLFGLHVDEPPITIANNLALDIRPGDIALFTGPSGSGKSSLLREVAKQLGAVDAMALELPEVPLIEALPGPLENRLKTLTMCGLGEARLLLRSPRELSDGQRYRFRIAYAMTQSKPIVLDEFTANLDRTLAKVVAYNLRKHRMWGTFPTCHLNGHVGNVPHILAATTHEDIIEDLNPNIHIRCHGEGEMNIQRYEVAKRPFSLAKDLTLQDGTAADWQYFAKWHYRSHHLAFTRKIITLKHHGERVGICVFAAPAASLTLRTRYFGLTNPRSRHALAALNPQLWVLSRVVLHPTWRGAGIAARFVADACRRCPVPWIETLSAMGRVNPIFERAGFERVGTIQSTGGNQRRSADSEVKSRHSSPVYYVRNNHNG